MIPEHAAALAELETLPLPWDDESFREGVMRVGGFSRFGLDILRRYPEAVRERWSDGAFLTPTVPSLDPDPTDDATLLRTLRVARHVGMLEILWRDVMGISDVVSTIREVTELADRLSRTALAQARAPLERFGSPRDRSGRPLDLIVFGLGKLGGFELNYSSDVDLVYAFAEAGETDGRKSIANEDYFRRLGTQLTRLLTHATEDGFCYRVDLRLRPYGTAGRVALSAAAMEHYFEREGRSWERYAWIKARPIAGDLAGGDSILETLRPFVYRRYLDYGAFDSLRDMKAMIRAEVERKGFTDHIKLGRGGIREIEFFAQAFQLIRGGREPALRTRSLLGALSALAERGEISAETCQQLTDAYCFLRRLENRFQQVADEQTHRPPDDPALRDAIASSLGADGWTALAMAWEAHRALVAECFETVFAPENGEAIPRIDRWVAAWRTGGGWPERWSEPIERFRASSTVRTLETRGRRRLDRLMPLLLEAVDQVDDARQDDALERCLGVVSAVARRSTYLAMLTEKPDLLSHLVAICARSHWITDLLSRHPLMLDELIDHRSTGESAAAHLERRLETAEGDLEQEMEILREVRDSRAIRLAERFLAGDCTAEAVSLGLAETTDALLDAIYRLAWRDLAAKHGAPAPEFGGLAIVGYGTLGGRELSFDSDLDIVFLYGDDIPATAMTDGDRPVAVSVFFTRLCQRILHLLTTQTASGKLYEVDTRLRPNGRSGLLVSSLSAFRSYQEEKAWTWELQALSRARFVAGDGAIGESFEAIRAAMLQLPRDPGQLGTDVVEMRQKMRRARPAGDASGFDLKHGQGARIDLEFLTQFARLRWSAEDPAIMNATGTLGALRALQDARRLDAEVAAGLIGAYLAYRTHTLEQALDGRDAVAGADAFQAERSVVLEAWARWLGERAE
ncbi:MAG: bifunctional [glutamate--ammonia ligase]-adenylyl-L-tyrosine phosphorylase/[glutamate--ammonia-ligase] adenylyltransferase [Pseudomonadota bacterium]